MRDLTELPQPDRSVLDRVHYLSEYYYSFNGNPNYEAILRADGRTFRANVLTNPDPPHGVCTLEVWNPGKMDWTHVHTIPGSLMQIQHADAREGFREDFADDVSEALRVGLSILNY